MSSGHRVGILLIVTPASVCEHREEPSPQAYNEQSVILHGNAVCEGGLVDDRGGVCDQGEKAEMVAPALSLFAGTLRTRSA